MKAEDTVRKMNFLEETNVQLRQQVLYLQGALRQKEEGMRRVQEENHKYHNALCQAVALNEQRQFDLHQTVRRWRSTSLSLVNSDWTLSCKSVMYTPLCTVVCECSMFLTLYVFGVPGRPRAHARPRQPYKHACPRTYYICVSSSAGSAVQSPRS